MDMVAVSFERTKTHAHKDTCVESGSAYAARVRGHGWRRAAAFSLHRCSSTSSAQHADLFSVSVVCNLCVTCV